MWKPIIGGSGSSYAARYTYPNQTSRWELEIQRTLDSGTCIGTGVHWTYELKIHASLCRTISKVKGNQFKNSSQQRHKIHRHSQTRNKYLNKEGPPLIFMRVVDPALTRVTHKALLQLKFHISFTNPRLVAQYNAATRRRGLYSVANWRFRAYGLLLGTDISAKEV